MAEPPFTSPVQTPLGATGALPSAHLPSIQFKVKPRQWKSLEKGNRHHAYRVHAALRDIHDLLLLPELGKEELETLMTTAESLADYASKRMTAAVRVTRPSATVEDLGVRFLVLSALHDAVRAVGQEWPSWWHEVVRNVPVRYKVLNKGQWTGRRMRDAALAEELKKALELYKSGGAPSDGDVKKLKQALFCAQKSHYHFRDPEWNFLRQDDAGLCAR